MKKRTVILILLILILTPPFAVFRSVAVMAPYSIYHSHKSVQAQKGFDIDIPGGLSTPGSDWYPFVMTFNDSGIFKNMRARKTLFLL